MRLDHTSNSTGAFRPKTPPSWFDPSLLILPWNAWSGITLLQNRNINMRNKNWNDDQKQVVLGTSALKKYHTFILKDCLFSSMLFGGPMRTKSSFLSAWARIKKRSGKFSFWRKSRFFSFYKLQCLHEQVRGLADDHWRQVVAILTRFKRVFFRRSCNGKNWQFQILKDLVIVAFLGNGECPTTAEESRKSSISSYKLFHAR